MNKLIHVQSPIQVHKTDTLSNKLPLDLHKMDFKKLHFRYKIILREGFIHNTDKEKKIDDLYKNV